MLLFKQCWEVNSSVVTFLEVGFAANLVQGFRVYAWRAVPSFAQIALCFPSFALRPQPLRWTLWKPEGSVKFYKSLFKASSCVKSLQWPRWILSLPKSYPCFLSVPMSTNDHYFDNIDLTSHTTLPRASVADIDSLFLARPARAAREKGSLEETEENMSKQLFKLQNAFIQNTKHSKHTCSIKNGHILPTGQ